MGLKKALFVVFMVFVVFFVPGIVLAFLFNVQDLLKIFAFDVIFTVFFHPLQLLAVDWACYHKKVGV